MELMALSSEKISSIEAKATDLLVNTFGTEEITLPVNLGEVASKNGLTLKTARFDDEEAVGLFDRSKKTIYVAEGTALPRMAFTIAHELGHYVLHENVVDQETFWRLDTLNIDKQNGEQETEANWFAASLLMPRTKIIEFWKNTQDIDKLAAIFGVSRTAMLWRLRNLQLS